MEEETKTWVEENGEHILDFQRGLIHLAVWEVRFPNPGWKWMARGNSVHKADMLYLTKELAQMNAIKYLVRMCAEIEDSIEKILDPIEAGLGLTTLKPKPNKLIQLKPRLKL